MLSVILTKKRKKDVETKNRVIKRRGLKQLDSIIWETEPGMAKELVKTRERERERDTHTHKARQTQRDRPIDRQTDIPRETGTQRQTERERETHTHTEIEREGGREAKNILEGYFLFQHYLTCTEKE